MAHSHAEDILTAFTELYGGAQLPAALRTGMTDGKILKHYLLLHDSHLKPPGGVPWYAHQSSESDILVLGSFILSPKSSKRWFWRQLRICAHKG